LGCNTKRFLGSRTKQSICWNWNQFRKQGEIRECLGCVRTFCKDIPLEFVSGKDIPLEFVSGKTFLWNLFPVKSGLQ
jgi:hypothetical protein